MKIANIVKESLYIFWNTCGISMKFSEMITVKVTKEPGVHYLFSRYILKKTHRMGQIVPQPF